MKLHEFNCKPFLLLSLQHFLQNLTYHTVHNTYIIYIQKCSTVALPAINPYGWRSKFRILEQTTDLLQSCTLIREPSQIITFKWIITFEQFLLFLLMSNIKQCQYQVCGWGWVVGWLCRLWFSGGHGVGTEERWYSHHPPRRNTPSYNRDATPGTTDNISA